MRAFFRWLANLALRLTDYLGRHLAYRAAVQPAATTPGPGRRPMRRRRLSPWIKVPYAVFVGILVPVYWVHYGPSNFLWFSDLALLAGLLAVWLESALIASMVALAVLLPELAWNAEFFSVLLFDKEWFGLSAYMFDRTIPGYLRALSLFHVFLPPLLLWMVFRLGYDRRALGWQTVVAWIVLPLSYPFAHAPEHNINWTRGFHDEQHFMPDWLWVAMLMVGLPLLIYLPTHLLLHRLFAR